MAYYRRLRDLREDADMTQRQVAEYLGTTTQYYGKYEQGLCELPLERAAALAELFNVSLDYLSGRTNNKGGIGAAPRNAREAGDLPRFGINEQLAQNYSCLSAKSKLVVSNLIEVLSEEKK